MFGTHNTDKASVSFCSCNKAAAVAAAASLLKPGERSNKNSLQIVGDLCYVSNSGNTRDKLRNRYIVW